VVRSICMAGKHTIDAVVVARRGLYDSLHTL
jgi:hypothetical protein